MYAGLAVSQNIHLPDFQNLLFQYQIIYDLEEKFVQIYLPDGQFYLPRTVGQWDMSSPVYVCFYKWQNVYQLMLGLFLKFLLERSAHFYDRKSSGL